MLIIIRTINALLFYLRFEQEINEISQMKSKPMFVPSQVKQLNVYNTAPAMKSISKPPMLNIPAPSFNSTFQQIAAAEKFNSNSIILSSAPKLYSRPNVPTVELPPSHLYSSSSVPQAANFTSVPANFNMNPLPFEISTTSSKAATTSSKKSKSDKTQQNLNAEDIIKAAKASSALQSFGSGKDKRKVDKKTVRAIGGVTWEDQTLLGMTFFINLYGFPPPPSFDF